MKRTLLGAAVAAALVATLPSVGAPADATTGPSATVSRLAVTPGSYLALTERGPDGHFGSINVKSQSLVLVSPTGEARTLYTRPVKKFRTMTLTDWSADGATALLVASDRHGGQLIRVDVATGATQVTDVPLLDKAVLDPAGTGVIATAWRNENAVKLVLETISWAGVTTKLRDDNSGVVLPAHGGTVLTTDSRTGKVQLLLSTTTGAVVNQFRVNGYCTPIRWWDATQVLESCRHGNLYLVDPTTGNYDQLTSTHGEGDYGHFDARYVGSRLYVQVAGACGYTYVAKVTKHSTQPVKVPGAVGNVIMVNAVGDDLVLEHAASCDGDRPRSVLSLFDPATRKETPLLRLGKHEDFATVRLLGEVRATTY